MAGRPKGVTGPGNEPFLLAVITLPVFFPGEAEILEGLLAAGLEKLHLRKPGAGEEAIEGLLQQITPRWRSRLVLHGGRKLWGLATRYGVPQVHCPLNELAGERSAETSASLHSWEEMKEIERAGLAYVFMSPVFDSISKQGHTANSLLLQRPAGPYPCKVIGLGGIDMDTIGELIRGGWDGAAVLGWIWEQPGTAVERYVQLKNSISLHCL